MINLNDAETSHRFIVRALDTTARPRSVIGWRVSEVRYGKVVRAVVLTLDATWDTAVVLTPEQAEAVAEAIAHAAHTREP